MPLIRVYTRDNGAGLGRDLQLITTALQNAGFDVEPIAYSGEKGMIALRQSGQRIAALWRGKADAQIFIERVYPRMFAAGKRNFLVPNPEWFAEEWKQSLSRFDAVLCKTHHAQPLFEALGCRTEYIGFTSEDRLDRSVRKKNAYFHLAGRSSAKGTQVLLETWQKHPEWPQLTVVQSASKAKQNYSASNIDHRIGYIEDAELKQLQNAHLFHACPSEMEGFGHSLMEAMSVGGVVLTTDGEPMNELVQPDRGWLLHPSEQHSKDLAPRYFVAPEQIEHTVSLIQQASLHQIQQQSQNARMHFEHSDQQFRQQLPRVIGDLILR